MEEKIYFNLQQLFEAVVTHVVKQGRPAISQSLIKYRTSDGLKCAFGGIIPDYAYSPEIEDHSINVLVFDKENFGKGWITWIAKNPVLNEFSNTKSYVLREIQMYVHDKDTSWETLESYKAAVEYVAGLYNLNLEFFHKLDFSAMEKYFAKKQK
ncbi:MAG TPA: hypothetical protein PLP33_24585 [Leptospiraceae bacterium]|nr:hypothetical protein [Leptospiraceae bacterium]